MYAGNVTCSGAYSHHYLLGGSGDSPPENFFLKCFKMAHFHGSSIIMLLLGAYIWALGQYGVNTLKVLYNDHCPLSSCKRALNLVKTQMGGQVPPLPPLRLRHCCILLPMLILATLTYTYN